MQEHHSAASPTSSPPSGYDDASAARRVPVQTVGPTRKQLSTERGGWLTSPVTWLTLATLLAAAIVVLFLLPVRNTATDNPPARVQAPIE